MHLSLNIHKKFINDSSKNLKKKVGGNAAEIIQLLVVKFILEKFNTI